MRFHENDPGGKDAVYNADITVNGKKCRISLHKNDDLEAVIDKQVNEQTKS